MTPSVPDETPNGQAELLAQLRDLVPSAFLDGELDRDALFGAPCGAIRFTTRSARTWRVRDRSTR